MTSWAKGTTANSLCSCTDYNLLFKGEEQVKICFIAYHEWIAKPIVVYNSYTIVNSGPWISEKYPTPKTKGTEPSVVYMQITLSVTKGNGIDFNLTKPLLSRSG